MTDVPGNSTSGEASDRRSSVRATSLLPCAIRPIDESEVPEVEAKILDLAVVESDSVMDEESLWDERSDDLSREATLVLNEIRALRRKLTELQQTVERKEQDGMESRWVTINDRGFRVADRDDEFDSDEGDLLEVELQIPSIHSRNVLAIGEVIRVDSEDSERGPGLAVEFRSIAQIHEKAIMRYALLRERHVARSDRFSESD